MFESDTVAPEGLIKALATVTSGEADGLVMHVDTLRLFTDQDWDLLKAANCSVGCFERIESAARSAE